MTRLAEIKKLHRKIPSQVDSSDIAWLISRIEKLEEALDQIWRIEARHLNDDESSSIMADIARAALEEE